MIEINGRKLTGSAYLGRLMMKVVVAVGATEHNTESNGIQEKKSKSSQLINNNEVKKDHSSSE